MNSITQLPEWQALKQHQQWIKNQSMKNWFASDPFRFEHFSTQFNDLLFDYSKNRITKETLTLLFKLAEATQLKQKIEALFQGKPLNFTENRPALHTALRNKKNEILLLNGHNIMTDIHQTIEQMRSFTYLIREKIYLGATQKPISDIVNVGIGGSHLGPLMAVHALREFASPTLKCHFISTIDRVHLKETLDKINPETTLFIISSKSFTTLETVSNLKILQQWLQQKLQIKDISAHFVAVTANTQKALELGIKQHLIFPLWDWVGGRYSVWSAIGLPIALMIGIDKFLDFLAGGHAMDQQLRCAPDAENMPLIMALLGIWYINFFGAESHAIIPYSHKLNWLRAHLQQLDMESNGKQVGVHGALDHATGPIIWGEHGCNGQHAFHQLLHQGQHLIPIDFLFVADQEKELPDLQDVLIASGLSQAEALMKGKTVEEAFAELRKEGYSLEQAEQIAIQKTIPGNRPSNILFLNKMTPYNLGLLLALYEHKIFIQGAIWNINSFDQWGVELGKQLLPRILSEIQRPSISTQHDSSTLNLIKHYRNLKKNRVQEPLTNEKV